MQRGFRGSVCPLGPPVLQEWDGDLWGDTGQGDKGSPQNPGSSWPWGSGKIPVWGVSLLFPVPQSLPAPPIPWASCSSRGDPTPMSCLTAAKRFGTTVMAHGKILLG